MTRSALRPYCRSMTSATPTDQAATAATAALTPEEDRRRRLTEAGAAWVSRIDARPQAAQLSVTVDGAGFGSVSSDITAGQHRFTVDEPAPLAGDDAAPSPVEYALGALIGCQVVVYRLYAEALQIPVDDIDIRAVGELDVRGLFGLDDSVRAGFQDIHLEVTITGPDTAERYEQLRQVVNERCPVHDLFANPTPVTSAVTVVPRAA